MHFLNSVLLTVGVGFGALGMLAMAAGAVCATLIEAADDAPLTPPPSTHRATIVTDGRCSDA